jgi:hypothetical protein
MGVKSSLYGSNVQVDASTGALYGGALGEVALVQPCADASITVGAESVDVRAITITLKDANGNAINYAEQVDIIMLASAAAADFAATGGSTGIAIGASGKLLTVVAKKLFKAISTTGGVIALTWTDTGTESVAVGVRLPNGRIVPSAALRQRLTA